MFVRYFVEVPLAAAQVERAMRHPPPGWLSAMAGAAQQRGDELLTEVGVGPLGPRLGRRVAIRLGTPVRFPSMVSLPLTWEPLGLEGLLPRLDANIELGSLGGDRTQLAISAHYRPPLRVVGAGGRPGAAAPGGRGDPQGLPGPARPGHRLEPDRRG